VQTDSELSDIFLRAYLLRPAGIDRAGHRRSDSDRLRSFTRHLSHQGISNPQLSAIFLYRS
jgi:hypothetical protein